jgi:hypothetical protein
MDREQEEAVQRITARYMAELRAGHQPHLSDYLSRYPQYADAITDFVAYYHAAEMDIPEESDSIPALSQTSRAALDDAWKRVLHSESVNNTSAVTLQVMADNQGKSFPELALEIGLSIDILEKLERHIIDTATIPKEVCKRLTKALQQPLIAIEMYLGLAERKHLTQGLAEEPAAYRMEVQSNVQAQNFREAVEQSTRLPNEQKEAWRAILTEEGL